MDYAVPDGTAIFLLLKYECFTIYKKVDEEKKKELLELIMSSGKSESEIKEFFGKTE